MLRPTGPKKGRFKSRPVKLGRQGKCTVNQGKKGREEFLTGEERAPCREKTSRSDIQPQRVIREIVRHPVRRGERSTGQGTSKEQEESRVPQ